MSIGGERLAMEGRTHSIRKPLQLRPDLFHVDHHRAASPGEFRLDRIHDIARSENLAAAGDEAPLSRAARSLHRLGGDEQPDPFVVAEILFGLPIAAGAGKTSRSSFIPSMRM